MTSKSPHIPKKGWTIEKNKRFENALAVYGNRVHDNWHNIAMFVGDTTEEHVQKYYRWLVEDLEKIEAGLIPIPNYMDVVECSGAPGEDDDAQSSQGSNNEDAECTQVDISTEEKKEGMPDAAAFSKWDELTSDLQGVIFTYLSLEEKLTIVPSVCKSWASILAGPYCWQEIDIEEWSSISEPDKIDRMLEMLIARSSGFLRKLAVSCIQTEKTFTLIAENAGSLETLRLQRCNITDSIVEDLTKKISKLSFLDVSYCDKIGPYALETIGKNCKMLEVFCRNMHPSDTAGKPFEDDEAIVISTTMPNLKHIGITYNLIKTEGALQILSNCSKLELLDLRGCWGVNIANISVEKNFPSVKVLGPAAVDYHEKNGWDDFLESSEYLGWDFLVDEYYDDESDIGDEIWDDEEGLGEIEFTFYHGIENVEMFWPPHS